MQPTLPIQMPDAVKFGPLTVPQPTDLTLRIVRVVRKGVWARFWAWFGIGTRTTTQEIKVGDTVVTGERLAVQRYRTKEL